MQRTNNHKSSTKLYGSVIKLNGKRTEPFRDKTNTWV